MSPRSYTIEDMEEVASQRGGECLSEEYRTMHHKLLWRCGDCGHEWWALPLNVVHKKKWCKKCGHVRTGKARRKYSIQDLKAVAHEYGGECLSEECIGVGELYQWRCSKGHTWEASAASILYPPRTWCAVCSGKKAPPLSEMQQLASKRGFKLLSEEYVDSETDLLWECPEGHQFEKRWGNFKNGQGCPKCRSYQGEELVRAYFEAAFGKFFPTKRPSWLLNATGHRMELDGYCEELGIAFEHQGKQHYEPTGRFTSKEVKKIKARDKLKLKLCSDQGIKLVIVPSVFGAIGVPNLEKEIRKSCRKAGIKFPKLKAEPDLVKAYTAQSRKFLKRLSAAASQRGLTLLSEEYLGYDHKYEYICGNGHRFSTVPDATFAGYGCRFCSKTPPLTQERINSRIKGLGECLTEVPEGSLSEVEFRCNQGHVFEEVYERVINRVRLKCYFCPTCKAEGKTDTWHDRLWERNFKKLSEFARQHGHCKVPVRYDKSLHYWVKRLRQVDKQGDSTTSRLLIGDRKKRLSQIGFEFASVSKKEK
jgi:hypothetical protein